MSQAQPIPGYAERLKAAADDVQQKREALALSLAHRNEIITEAVDNGFPQTAAAKNGRVSQPHVVRIMASSYADVADLVA